MFSKLLLVFILVVLPFGVVCEAQEQSGSLNNFTGNNTSAGLFGTKVTDSRVAHNVDFNRVKGAICPRWGYDSISGFSPYVPPGETEGISGIVDIFTLKYSDGSERLLVISDTITNDVFGSGIFNRGNVDVTPIGSTNFDSLSRIATWFPTTGVISATMYRDVLYLSSSTARGLVWDGTYSREWPLLAPGEPIVQINKAGSKIADNGNLSGEYRWLFLYRRIRDTISDLADDSLRFDSTLVTRGGYITRPVRLDYNSVAISGFSEQTADSIYQDTLETFLIKVYAYRTKGDVGRIDPYDYAYYTGVSGTFDAGLAQGTLYDDVADSLLPASAAATTAGIPDSIIVMDGDYLPTDTSRYGSGGLSSTIDTLTVGAAGRFGIFADTTNGDSVFDTNIQGFAYTFSFTDTILKLTSDTGRSFIIRSGGDSAYMGYDINIPRVKPNDSLLMVNVYRAPLVIFTFDTARGFFYNGEPCEWNGAYIRVDDPNADAPYWIKDYPCIGGPFEGGINRFHDIYTEENVGLMEMNYHGASITNFWITPDSLIVGAFHKIAMVSPAADSDIVFRDTAITMDSLISRPLLTLRYVPPFISQVFVSNSRLYGISGDGVYYSHLDSVATFGVFNQVALSVDDGEDITLAFESRNTIRTFKQTSNFNLWYEPGVGLNQQEISPGLGCVAPRSYAAHATGHYYLSNFGLVREGESDFLQRRQKYEYLSSGRITSFDDLSSEQLDSATAVIFDDKYMLSIGDTTYVYDIISDTWSTWSMTFKKAVVYRNNDNYNSLLGDSMFFIGNNNLYQYKTDNSDTNDVEIVATWKSVELETDRMYDQVAGLGLWVTDSVPGATSFNVTVIAADGDTINTVSYDSTDFAHRYLEKQMSYNLSRYFQIQITTSGDTSGVGISGIEPIITKQGLGIRK